MNVEQKVEIVNQWRCTHYRIIILRVADVARVSAIDHPQSGGECDDDQKHHTEIAGQVTRQSAQRDLLFIQVCVYSS